MPSGVYIRTTNKGWFKKGHPKLSNKGDFKKGNKGHIGNNFGRANKGRNMKELLAGRTLGFKNGMWKGDDAKYSALHLWVVRCKGNPNFCEHCGKVGRKNGRNWNIHWANKKHTYKRILEDFIGLCRSCHLKYDLENNLKRDGNNFNSHI